MCFSRVSVNFLIAVLTLSSILIIGKARQGKARHGKFICIAHFIHSGNSKCFT